MLAQKWAEFVEVIVTSAKVSIHSFVTLRQNGIFGFEKLQFSRKKYDKLTFFGPIILKKKMEKNENS